MRNKRFPLACLLFLAGVSKGDAAPVDSTAVNYDAAGKWVVDVPALSDQPDAAETPLKMRFIDNQVHIEPDGTQVGYTAYRFKIAKPEALSAGNVVLSWLPDYGSVEVHYVRLIRDGHVSDVLATTKFSVVQREEKLEQSVLTGLRTASLQVPGLQVGDEIAFAATIRSQQPVFGGHVAGRMQLPTNGASGAYRIRLLWPQKKGIVLRTSSDLSPPKPIALGSENQVELALTNPVGAIPTEDAPPRYNVRRLLEYSDFGSWADVSRLMAPLYEKASSLGADSPIKAEVNAIAARTKDPVERTEAALRLVQDRIRYVYVGLNGGNYVPATAEETWQRRYGDCKGKSVLLVAILRELGIEARTALVNSNGGDGIDQRLPGPDMFDHIIVRAIVANKTRWLDATQQGNSYLDNQLQPFSWALPISVQGSNLENIAPRDTGFPVLIGLVDIDASKGIDEDAQIKASNIVRGAEAFALRTQLSGLSADDADRALKSYWRSEFNWATADKVSWSYDERRMAITLGVIGRGTLDWTGDASKGHSYTLLGAGFVAPDSLRRPLDQDQTANWSVVFPRFRCWATTFRLPKPDAKFVWSLYAEPLNERIGGVEFWRNSGMKDSVVRTIMSRRSYTREITPEEAKANNKAIPRFNNHMSSVSEETLANKNSSSSILPFDENIDWLTAPTPCFAQ